MSKPIAICIENLNARAKTPRYLRCVALPGRQPGLRLDKSGEVVWQRDDVLACELWVSADQRLILYRQEDMVPVTLHRAGRSLKVPSSKPVVLVDQDQVKIGRRRLRIHIHGEAPAASAPSALPVSPGAISRLVQAAATAAVVGATLVAGGCETVEVRENPPVVETVVVTQDETPTPIIEVRENPPVVVTEMLTPTLDERLISELIQGKWDVHQPKDPEGMRTWIDGALTIAGDSYTFNASGRSKGTQGDLSLNFFIDHPSGKVAIEYVNGVRPDDAFNKFTPGDVLGTLTFRSNSEVSDEFLIRVQDTTSLKFDKPSNEDINWRIIKDIGADLGE